MVISFFGICCAIAYKLSYYCPIRMKFMHYVKKGLTHALPELKFNRWSVAEVIKYSMLGSFFNNSPCTFLVHAYPQSNSPIKKGGNRRPICYSVLAQSLFCLDGHFVLRHMLRDRLQTELLLSYLNEIYAQSQKRSQACTARIKIQLVLRSRSYEI